MSNLKPDEIPTPPHIGWPMSQRLADMRREIERALADGRLLKLKPGFVAGTFGVTKDDVRAEILKHNELGGGK